MQNRTPIAPAARPPLPDFAPVPRKYRHDGWTPARQRAFIEALADTGSVTRAAGMVNMAQTNCYALRRAPGADGFRRAWDAALDFGVQRLKDIAFERAIEGQLIPVFVGGKLMGFRRKHNDRLLMFMLRHYGQDGEGRRTTINYFRATAHAGGDAGNDAGADDPAEPFVRVGAQDLPFHGVLESALPAPGADGFAPDEPHWRHAGGDDPRVAVEAAVASVKRAKRRSNWNRGADATQPAGGES